MKKSTEKSLTRMLCACAVLFLLSTSACKPKVVDAEAYPEPEVEAEAENESSEEKSEEKKDEFREVDITSLLKTPPDTLSENGVFEFNDYLMNPRMLELCKDKPFVVLAAYDFLAAAVNFDPEFTLNPDYVLTEDDIMMAQVLAFSANPLGDMAAFQSDDNIHWTIAYCPKMAVNEVSSEEYEMLYSDGKEPAEAERIYQNYVDYVTNMINENLSADSTDMERAEIVYRKLIEDFEAGNPNSLMSTIEYKDGVSYYSVPSIPELMYENECISDYYVPYLFHDIMLQLGVESTMVYATGKFGETDIKSLKDYHSYQTFQTWVVITSEEKSYNCDLMMDMYAYKDFKEAGNEGTYQPKFFGMSDERRSKSFEAETSDTDTGIPVPECTEDFYDNIILE